MLREGFILKNRIAVVTGLGTLLMISTSSAFAGTVSADYSKALTIDGDEGLVAAFNLFDFAVGATLIQAASTNIGTQTAPVVGDKFKGYYQSYVTSHQLDGIVQAAGNLNTAGSGVGYELTVVAEYDEVVSSVGPGGSYNSDITGGSASLYFDSSPNFSFTSGTGFADGEAILTGDIVGGGAVSVPSLLAGFAQINVAITGQNSAIFNPNIAAANGIFTLALNSEAVNGVTSVLGHAVGPGDLLLGADGNLEVQAVPVPAAAWLLGSALIGMVSVGRRAKA